MEPWLDELLAVGRWGAWPENREVQAGHVLALHVVVRCFSKARTVGYSL